MQSGVAGLLLWIAVELALAIVTFGVLQGDFNQARRRTHEPWRQITDRPRPSHRELPDPWSSTFEKHEDASTEAIRRRYLTAFALTIGWGFLGLPVAWLLEGLVRRVINLLG